MQKPAPATKPTPPASPEPLLLALETSGLDFSVALADSTNILGSQHYRRRNSHSRLVTVAIATLLQNLAVSPTAIRAVAVSAGPGSYTGLRIGTAAAKGLCHGWGVPLVAVNTLAALAVDGQALAHAVKGHMVALLDARRDEVYAAVYTPDLTEVQPAQPLVLQPTAFEAYRAQGPLVLVGDGAAKTAAAIPAGDDLYVLPGAFPHAAAVARLGYTRWQAGRVVAMENFAPTYLKPVQATVGKPLV